jgi:sulfur carrier protein
MALLEAGLILGAAEVEAALGSRVGAGDVGGASDGAGEEGEPGRDGPPDAAPGDEALLWLRVAARPGRPARVTVKLFASLRRGRFETAVFELGAGATVEAALAAASLPPAEASIIFVNARHALPASPLAEGDLVSVFPPIGGG